MNLLRQIFSRESRTSGQTISLAESKSSASKPHIYLESDALLEGIFSPKLNQKQSKIENLAQKVTALRQAHSKYDIDGFIVETSGFMPQNPDEISNFEHEFDVNLPEDFKAFINVIGFDIIPYYRPELSVEIIDLPMGDRDGVMSNQADWYLKAERKALKIADYGCGIYFILCLFEPEHGNVWILDESNTGTASPIIPKNSNIDRVRFQAWYEYWLNAALASIDRELS